MRQEDLINFFQRAIQPLKNRVYLIAGRAILAAINDTAKIQEVQVQALAGEILDKVQRFQEFGFTSNPPVGTEAIMLSLAGSRGNSVIIATENREVRVVNLASGETAIYTDDGTYIELKKAGQVEVKAATLLTIDVPDTLIKGKLTVQGATTLQDVLGVAKKATFTLDAQIGTALVAGTSIAAGTTITAGGVVAAAGYTGPAGAAVSMTVDLATTGNITGGGTNLADVKSKFNAHTHTETGTVTNATGTPL